MQLPFIFASCASDCNGTHNTIFILIINTAKKHTHLVDTQYLNSVLEQTSDIFGSTRINTILLMYNMKIRYFRVANDTTWKLLGAPKTYWNIEASKE